MSISFKVIRYSWKKKKLHLWISAKRNWWPIADSIEYAWGMLFIKKKNKHFLGLQERIEVMD